MFISQLASHLVRGGSTLGQGARAPRFTCPQIQKLANCSDVISAVQKCSKIQIFQGLQCSPRPLSWWREGSLPRIPLALGPSGLISAGLSFWPITELVTLLMIDFKCRPIWSHVFSVSENGENGLSDEGADGAPRIFWLEPPLHVVFKMSTFCQHTSFKPVAPLIVHSFQSTNTMYAYLSRFMQLCQYFIQCEPSPSFPSPREVCRKSPWFVAV